MEKSEDISLLAIALTKAQVSIKGAIKDSKNPFYKSSYADLESVWDACKDALKESQLAVSQLFGFTDSGIDYIETVLMHESGQWISGKQRLYLKEQTPQAMGSATTYNRRISLSAILSMIQVDDDGHGASYPQEGNFQKAAQTAMSRPMGPINHGPSQIVSGSKVTEAQLRRLFAVSKSVNISDEQIKELMKKLGLPESRKDLDRGQYDKLVEAVKAWKPAT